MILYHGGIGSYKFNRTEPKISVLESYAHTKHPKLKDWMGSYFMDSGAYSVWCSGKTIDLQSFIAFCKEHGKMFTAVAALDVIGSSEGSFENYLRMRDAGRSAKQTTAVMDELRVWVESIGGDWERAVRKDAGGAYERAWISVHELNRIANTAPTTYNPRVKGFQL